VSNRLIRNMFSAAGQTVAQTAILMLLYRYLIVQIGIEQLGIWSVVLATGSAARVSELGFGGSITRFVAAYRAQNDHKAAAEILQTAIMSVGVLFGASIIIVYPLLLLALQYVLPTSGLIEGRNILPYGLVSLLLTSIASILMRGLDACLRSELRAGIMILGNLIFFLLSILSVRGYGLLGLAVAQVLEGAILAVLGWIVLRRVMPLLPIIPLQWKKSRFKEMLSYGVNFQINTLVMLLFEPITKILLGRYGGLSAAGYFEMAQRLVLKIRGLLVESNRVIVPVYASMASYKNEAPALYERNMHHLLFWLIPVFAALVGIAPAISEVWVGSFQKQFVTMVVATAFAWMINIVSAPAYFAYLGQGKLRWVTIAHVVMGGTSIFSGIILGHILGWHGVITGYFFSLMLGSLIPLWAYHYEYKIKIIRLLSISDAILAGVCFGAALISLSIYWAFIDATLLNKWTRASMTITCMGIVSIAAIWFHPKRRNIVITIKARLKSSRGT